MKHVILLAGLLFLFSGCNYREREKALTDREQALVKREQELFVQQQNLQLKQSALELQLKKLDSTLHDTAIIINQDLIGSWNVKMTCTETSCHGSAVGDSKTEVWDIYYSTKRIVAKVMDGKKLARIYTGSYAGGQLELNEEVDMSPGIPNTQILVRLTMTDPKTMDGQREIVRTGDCRILYTLQLKKQ